MSFVRFFTKKRSTVGYLVRYGSRLKTETENGVFLQQYGKRFSLKNGKRYGFRLRCRGFLSPNRGNGRSRNGRVRYGTVWFGSVRYGSVRSGQGDKFGRTTVSLLFNKM